MGIELDRDLALVWTADGARLIRFRVFKTREDALPAAGS
jgi:hypothetical protein